MKNGCLGCKFNLPFDLQFLIEMKKILFFLALSIISTSSFARELTQEEKNVVEESIKNQLKDPFSVVFKHNDYPYPDETHIYCGSYNAKNSYGAFVGNQLFAVFIARNRDGELVAPRMDIDSSTGSQSDDSVISATCASAGYDIPVIKMFFSGVNKERAKLGIPSLGKEFIRK